ncbi:MAG TPA: hypothetical protein VFC45_09005 [Pseudolabrys sp.]|nr:hypothetical protein [Pseudolabrys sp.]
MRWLIVAAVIGIGGALSGCATDVGPSPAELKARWEAENIFPQTYKNDLLAFLRTYLNDPEHVRAAQVSQPLLKTVGPGERYIVCVRFSERKPNGNFPPPKDGAASYVSGKLDRFFDTPPAEVKSMCKDVPLEPFPELEKLKR